MGTVGKTPNQRRGVRVKTSSPKNNPSEVGEKASSFPTAPHVDGFRSSSANTSTVSSQQVAAYIAEMCLALVLMAKGANLTFVAHLLVMAQAEAEYAAESVA